MNDCAPQRQAERCQRNVTNQGAPVKVVCAGGRNWVHGKAFQGCSRKREAIELTKRRRCIQQQPQQIDWRMPAAPLEEP